MIEYTSWDDPVIGLEIRTFNWRLRKARTARGWSRAELARQCGLQATTVGQAEKLERVSANARERMAITLQIPEDELFPGVVDALEVSGPGVIEIPFTDDQVNRWIDTRAAQTLPEEVGDGIALTAAIEAQLSTLSPRAARVIRHRFGLGRPDGQTFEEVGHEFGVSRERVRQIEAEGLRKLRRLGRDAPLREFVYEDRGSSPSVKSAFQQWVTWRSTAPSDDQQVSGMVGWIAQHPCCACIRDITTVGKHLWAAHDPQSEVPRSVWRRLCAEYDATVCREGAG